MLPQLENSTMDTAENYMCVV